MAFMGMAANNKYNNSLLELFKEKNKKLLRVQLLCIIAKFMYQLRETFDDN